jgi:hypothetical protein
VSDKHHRRVLRLLGAVGCAGLAVLVCAPAALARTNGPTVTFNGGGIGVLSCPSRPDTGQVSLSEGSWVNVVNNTGYDADLKIGTKRIGMPSGAGRSVSLAPGHYTMRLEPTCLVNLSDAESVSVEVAAARSAPSPSSAPGGTGGSTSTSGSSGGSRSSSGAPRSTAPRETSHADEASPDLPAPLGASPAGTPPVGGPTLDELGGADVPPPGELPSADGSVDGDVVAVTEFEPSGDLIGPRRASRLLALIAAVCVLGVTIAAFRAIVSQRTRRAIAV